jgi:fermentation-respiration switch protein FrsA (DUF1100 family)
MPVKWPILVGLIFIVGIAFYLFYPKIENFFVFFPHTTFDETPEDLHLQYQDVYFNTKDGIRLHGWLFPNSRDYPIILFCHGNAGNISHRLENVRDLLEKKLQVFIFDYRGYGRSDGRPSERGLYRDGEAAYDHLVREGRFRPEDIILFGRSLGAAVAIDLSLKRDVRSLVLESAFTSTKDMAKTMLLFSLLSPLLPANYNNLKKIEHVAVPKLIIHGGRDEIVPSSMGRKLFDAAKSPKYFFPIEEAGHNDTYVVGGDTYFQAITDFVNHGKI